MLNDNKELVHVNTNGRCADILKSGSKVLLQPVKSDVSKTKYSIYGVYKENKLINVDLSGTNKMILNSIKEIPEFKDVNIFKKPLAYYGSSKFDIYFETPDNKGFLDIIPVPAIDDNGTSIFPDAITKKGANHLKDMVIAKHEGYNCHILFVAQTNDVRTVKINYKVDSNFNEALKEALENGINLIAYDLKVTYDSILLGNRLNIEY
jgi:sugar fermentation stimulation protein A